MESKVVGSKVVTPENNQPIKITVSLSKTSVKMSGFNQVMIVQFQSCKTQLTPVLAEKVINYIFARDKLNWFCIKTGHTNALGVWLPMIQLF